MRPSGLVVLLLLLALVPPAEAGERAHDLIVLVAPGAPLPDLPGAVQVASLHALVVHDAAPSVEAGLRARGDVLSVERAEPLALASDPNLMLTRVQPAPVMPSGAPYDGAGVTVAIVDSGIDRSHPDLLGRVVANVKLVDDAFVESPGDSDGHGTHVAGIVGADGASSGGEVRGVAPGAQLVGVDISDRFTTASAMLAYDWLAANRERYGIDVVVNAWGRVGNGRAFDASDPEIRAIDRLVDAGVVVLFSASNHGPGPSTLSLEAQDPRVVTVGAVDAAGELASYSSRGPVVPPAGVGAWVKPDVVAPGDSIVGLKSAAAAPDPEADRDAFHRAYSGTSQAVPHVAGIVAMMLQANPSLSPLDVQRALRESAIDIAEPGPDDATGFGLVDAADAVHRALGQPNDRLNVLVAGGTDRYEESDRLAAPDAGPAGVLGFASAPTRGWATTFPVKPGATLVTFDLSWQGPATPVTVTLERDGVVRGSWTGSAQVSGRVEAPEPGVWTLRAQGAAPVALEVASVVQVAIKGDASRGADLDERYRLPDAFGPLPVGSPAASIVPSLPLGAVAGVAGGAFALGGGLAALLWRRKAKPPAFGDEWGRAP